MYRIFAILGLIALIGVALSCGSSAVSNSSSGAGSDTPTAAYKRLYDAVKAKDMNAIKAAMTQRSIDFGHAASKQYGKPEDSMLENGFTATTFSDTLPNIRDERVKDNMGAVEVWNSKESKWEDLPFMVEGGQWKLAIGEMWANTWKSPGKGRDQIEKEAANALKGNTAVQLPAGNTMPMNAPPSANAAK